MATLAKSGVTPVRRWPPHSTELRERDESLIRQRIVTGKAFKLVETNFLKNKKNQIQTYYVGKDTRRYVGKVQNLGDVK